MLDPKCQSRATDAIWSATAPTHGPLPPLYPDFSNLMRQQHALEVAAAGERSEPGPKLTQCSKRQVIQWLKNGFRWIFFRHMMCSSGGSFNSSLHELPYIDAGGCASRRLICIERESLGLVY